MSANWTRKFVRWRRANVSWLLLASRRAPLVLGGLKPLFEESQDDLRWEDAVEKLAAMFAEHANQEEFAIPAGEQLPVARAELRDWLKRGLVVEREGRLIATDALQKVFHFLNSLEEEHSDCQRGARSGSRKTYLFVNPAAQIFFCKILQGI